MLQQLVAFRDRIDGFFSDKTILVSYGNSIDYYTSKGVKASIKIDRLASNVELGTKLTQMLEKYNNYSDTPLYWTGMMDEMEYVTKMNKIESCIWSSTVTKTPTGNKIYSLDRLASV